jgi:phosphoglycolate phosphatase
VPLVVGFDLDMTLIDSRPGIRAVWAEVVARTGAPIDPDVAVTRLGPPVEHELAQWVPPDQIAELAALYRTLYPDFAIETTPALPGALEALQAVHAAGGRTLVVTAKKASSAWAHVRHLGLAVDSLAGGLWAEQKGEALHVAGAVVYVGDHVSDIAGARAAGALSMAVATGPINRSDLLAAGADTVLDTLLAFPAWLADYVTAEPSAEPIGVGRPPWRAES